MFNEFQGETFPSTPWPMGEDALVFYEIDDINTGYDVRYTVKRCLLDVWGWLFLLSGPTDSIHTLSLFPYFVTPFCYYR